MGQAFRRASGKIKLPKEPSVKGVGERRPPEDKVEISRPTTQFTNDNSQDNLESSDGHQRINPENILEERDPQYDAMLSQMVGRIRPKAGGKLETGEAQVVQRYERPLPKLRNTKPDSSKYEEKPAPPGTLNVAQLRHIMLLYEGKADDHSGCMNIQQIAEKYRLEVTHVQRILQFMSLPPEVENNKKSFP